MITYRNDPDFYGTARQIIQGAEGFFGNVYADSVSIPTIGYGYALIFKNRLPNGAYEYVSNNFSVGDFAKIGVTLTATAMTLSSLA